MGTMNEPDVSAADALDVPSTEAAMSCRLSYRFGTTHPVKALRRSRSTPTSLWLPARHAVGAANANSLSPGALRRDGGCWHRAAPMWLAALLATAAPSVRADGCTVLLCFAGNWHSIAKCVPPVEQALRDMLFGGGFPVCAFADGQGGQTDSKATGNYGANGWPSSRNCPPMYSVYSEENGAWQSCIFTGVISLFVNGEPWTTVWWNVGGDTSTYYAPAALQQLGPDQIDPRYANDLAQWQAEHPPVPPQYGQGS